MWSASGALAARHLVGDRRSPRSRRRAERGDQGCPELSRTSPWLRAEAARRFAAGEPRRVTTKLRVSPTRGAAIVSSVQTMQEMVLRSQMAVGARWAGPATLARGAGPQSERRRPHGPPTNPDLVMSLGEARSWAFRGWSHGPPGLAPVSLTPFVSRQGYGPVYLKIQRPWSRSLAATYSWPPFWKTWTPQ